MGAGRKDTDKNRVASSTRGNSNNFIIIERKHRVIYAACFNDLRPRATFTATRVPREMKRSLFLPHSLPLLWKIGARRWIEINLAVSDARTELPLHRRGQKLRGANWHRFQLNLATNEKEKSRERGRKKKFNRWIGTEQRFGVPLFYVLVGKIDKLRDGLDRQRL